MKNLFFLFSLICITVSCSKDKFPQKWSLVKMKGNIPNSETTGENMSWQEYYLFKSNGSFTKRRVDDGVVYEASGSYTSVDNSHEKSLELIFDSESEIIGSCDSQNKTETLRIISNKKMIGTWEVCCGPKLEYKRVMVR